MPANSLSASPEPTATTAHPQLVSVQYKWAMTYRDASTRTPPFGSVRDELRRRPYQPRRVRELSDALEGIVEGLPKLSRGRYRHFESSDDADVAAGGRLGGSWLLAT